MKTHTAKQLRYWAAIIDPDGATMLSAKIGAGIEDLSGRRLEQAQLIAAETSHMILVRTVDAEDAALTAACYIRVDGTLYVIDYLRDPRLPQPRMWTEVYCHAMRTQS